jgi:hypothetical protein
VNSFYTLSVDKNKTFFDPLHLVIEWPQGEKKKKGSFEANAPARISKI